VWNQSAAAGPGVTTRAAPRFWGQTPGADEHTMEEVNPHLVADSTWPKPCPEQSGQCNTNRLGREWPANPQEGGILERHSRVIQIGRHGGVQIRTAHKDGARGTNREFASTLVADWVAGTRMGGVGVGPLDHNRPLPVKTGSGGRCPTCSPPHGGSHT
jgi:hypothetical protein